MKNSDSDNKLFNYCVRHEDISKCMMMYESGYKVNWEALFVEACMNERMLLLQWTYDTGKTFVTFEIFKIFIKCYDKNLLKSCEWLYLLHIPIPSSYRHKHHYFLDSEDSDFKLEDGNISLFEKCCLTGHLEICKWLRDIDPTITIDHDLIKKCLNVQPQMLEWLIYINSDPNIIINMFNDAMVKEDIELCERLYDGNIIDEALIEKEYLC